MHRERTEEGCLRKSDLLARYGGEEFGVLVPDAGAEATASLAERIRAEVEAGIYRDGATALELTASAGVASLQPSDGAIAGLMQRADGRLTGKSARRPDLPSALALISASRGADQGPAPVFPPGSRPRRLAF